MELTDVVVKVVSLKLVLEDMKLLDVVEVPALKTC